MRAIPVLSLVVLAGCATAVPRSEHSIFRPRVEVVHINGTFEPVVFAIDRAEMKRARRAQREACQSNDRMPVAFHGEPVSMTPRTTMPNAGTSQPPYMPNLCPVTTAPANKTVITAAPRTEKTETAPEPQP